ncbi:uncharacterized protein MYCFIDRAFT_171022 [Pseudocercospora fijiensis CIRAD86]|uniref:Uncharacterized protein n=1 Tax=Pseudocercospora fijiensis (strain CIRAD86) TaxID=383855 RepID=N1QCP3_PSEFD|nr:uncharacterized protein MYCFIDRAFT_171022 [Pseudocercospora fijiensis CIRAD86]EME89592.1 hypothetical protein MYCFIDRAFT_171022 [Pseudocercospora fijiensis CIRAD86]
MKAGPQSLRSNIAHSTRATRHLPHQARPGHKQHKSPTSFQSLSDLACDFSSQRSIDIKVWSSSNECEERILVRNVYMIFLEAQTLDHLYDWDFFVAVAEVSWSEIKGVIEETKIVLWLLMGKVGELAEKDAILLKSNFVSFVHDHDADGTTRQRSVISVYDFGRLVYSFGFNLITHRQAADSWASQSCLVASNSFACDFRVALDFQGAILHPRLMTFKAHPRKCRMVGGDAISSWARDFKNVPNGRREGLIEKIENSGNWSLGHFARNSSWLKACYHFCNPSLVEHEANRSPDSDRIALNRSIYD